MTRLFRGDGPVYKFRRHKKARMIRAVITAHLGHEPNGMRILDIGCGNGDIAASFAATNDVTGIDVADRRWPENRSFRFELVDSEKMPASDESLDVVISNHVIEHVVDQRLHLREIRRALRAGGIAYVATPNRTSPIMRGHVGNDKVLHYRDMQPMFEESGFAVSEYSVLVLRDPARYSSGPTGFRFVPEPVLRALRPLFPSHIFVLTR